MERGQFTFYSSFFDAIMRIKKAADRAAAYDAICLYALRGIEPDLDSLSDAAAVAFIVAKPNLDASKRKAESGKKGGESKQTESKRKQTESKTDSDESKKENKDKKENKKEDKNKKEREDECPPPTPSPIKHKHGEYGRVLLTDEQYAKLLGDLGEAELARCIAYVDESAQRTGNKNGWKDWALVIRKCHREGWGMRENQRERSSNPFLDMLREEGAI